MKLSANKDVTKDAKKYAIEVEKLGANKGVTLDEKYWAQKLTQKWMLKRTEKMMQQTVFYKNVQQCQVQHWIVHHNWEKITLKYGTKFDTKSSFCCSVNSKKLVKSEISSCGFAKIGLKGFKNSLEHHKSWRACFSMKWVSKSTITFQFQEIAQK